MAKVFSEHVEKLGSGGQIGADILDAVKGVLRSELRRRGILDYGPSLLGYLGNTWDDEALDDLAHDCYIRAIATRLRGLLANLARTGDIEQLVRKNIRTFVGERQRRLDPAGYAVFQNVKAAVLEALALATLERVEASAEAITASSELAFTGGDAKLATDAELDSALAELPESLADLIRINADAQEMLVGVIRQFPESGIRRFSVGALAQAIRRLISTSPELVEPAREVPADLFNEDFLKNIRTALPDVGYEEAEHVTKMVNNLRHLIDSLPRTTAVKSRVSKLLDHLSESALSGDTRQHETLDQLAERFQSSRSTIHDDFQCLRSLVARYLDRRNPHGDRDE